MHKGYAKKQLSSSIALPRNSAWKQHMSDSSDDMSMKNDDVLRVELEVFRRQHRDLDEAIEALVAKGTGDQLTIKRLKKQKLVLKDKIALIEDRLTPDIIA